MDAATQPPPAARRAGGHGLRTPQALAALFVAALALRPQLVGLGPLLPAMQTDLDIPHGLAGLLTAVPVLCMAVFALPAVRIAHRIGLRTAMAVALGAVVIFGALRPVIPSYPIVLLTTIGVGVGIGMGGALLPRATSLLVPSRVAIGTGLFSGGIQTGATLAAATAAPIAVLGDWRLSLWVFTAAGAVLLLAWLATTGPVSKLTTDDVWPRFPWTSPVAWRMVGIFALNSLVFYGLVTWLPSAYVDRGWSEVEAGRLVGLMNLAGIPVALVMPWLSDRSFARHRSVLAAGLVTVLAVGGILAAPDLALVWVVLAGAALGALFPLSMLLPMDIGRHDIAGHAAMMLTGGYAVAAIAPALLGVARDATGGFAVPFWILLLGGVVLCGLSVRELRPHR
jgi:CP family cyanate transporter-like MFS transporter